MEKKKLLIVNQTQFGYHSGNLQYCKYLKEEFDISFVSWDYKKPEMIESEIAIHYVSRKGNILKRNIRFILFVLQLLKRQEYSFTYIQYFRGSSFIPFYYWGNQKLHLDIRTGSVSVNKLNRILFNSVLRFESFFFKSISIISTGLRKRLRINKNAYILPLGANPVYVNRQSTNKLHLLYIGTFENRRIEDTIIGIHQFLKELPMADIHYTIIGDGWHNEKESFQRLINKLNLQKHIELKGYIPYNELLKFYETANVGVSYIPITSYFEFQPPTKTFEYLMAGMPVIATQTYENMQVISENNGVLIKDTPESFAEGIRILYNNISSFNEIIIRKSVENYQWSEIIQKMKAMILPNVRTINAAS
jgi:glycosyltransferase involved in cell wall biosynthesis